MLLLQIKVEMALRRIVFFALLLIGVAALLSVYVSRDSLQASSGPAAAVKSKLGSGGVELEVVRAHPPTERAASVAVGQGNAEPKTKLDAVPVGKLDWGKYQGTLQDQVDRAIGSRNGEMAIDLAAKLQECELNSRVLEVQSSTGGGQSAGAAVDTVRIERLKEYQRQLASCQTLGGTIQATRRRLLDVAVEQKIFGAAALVFATGDRNSAVARQVAQDAREGDLTSLFYVASNKASIFGIDENAQRAARYALKIASEDASVGARVRTYFEQAKILAGQLGEQPANFTDETARIDGVKIGEKLIANIQR